MANTKDQSPGKDESATTGKPVANTDSPQNSSRGVSTDMNEDELAAFNEIMGEIEGKQENQSNGTPMDTGSGDKDEPTSSEQEPAARGEDIDATGDENPTGTDIRESTATADIDSGDSTDDSSGGDS